MIDSIDPITGSNDINISVTSYTTQQNKLRSYCQSQIHHYQSTRDESPYSNDPVLRHAWYSHTQHCIVMSDSGRPIWCRFGDENNVNQLCGVILTLYNNTLHVHDNNQLHYIATDSHLYIILCKQSILIVSIVQCNNVSQLPIHMYDTQLNMIYKSLIFVLTKSVHTILSQQPNYDIRQLINGTEMLLWNMCNRVMLHEEEEVVKLSLQHINEPSYDILTNSIQSLYIPIELRQNIAVAMKSGLKQSYVHDNNSNDINNIRSTSSTTLIYAILSQPSINRIVHVIRSKHTTLYPTDITLLLNFLNTNPSFYTVESWLPICLPSYNNSTYLHVYVCYITSDLCLSILSTDSTQFNILRCSKQSIVTQLNQLHCIEQLNTYIHQPCIDINIIQQYIQSNEPSTNMQRSRFSGLFSAIPFISDTILSINDTTKHTTATDNRYVQLYHMLYRSTQHNQCISTQPIIPFTSMSAQQLLYKLYSECNQHRTTYWHTTQQCNILYLYDSSYQCWVTVSPFDSYQHTIHTAIKAIQWVQQNNNNLFM